MNRYAKECDVIKLGWLPIIERFEFNTTKLAFKALHCPEWPDYLPLKFHKSNYRVTLRNSDDYKLPYVKDKNTFKSDVYKCFNDLRKEINNSKFISGAKSFLLIRHLQGFRSFVSSNSNKIIVCATASILFKFTYCVCSSA